MRNLFELVETKKWANWMITISIILFVLSAVLHFSRWFDDYSLQFIIIYTGLILGTTLLLLGISLHVLSNNISRLMKTYDEALYKKMKK